MGRFLLVWLLSVIVVTCCVFGPDLMAAHRVLGILASGAGGLSLGVIDIFAIEGAKK